MTHEPDQIDSKVLMVVLLHQVICCRILRLAIRDDSSIYKICLAVDTALAGAVYLLQISPHEPKMRLDCLVIFIVTHHSGQDIL